MLKLGSFLLICALSISATSYAQDINLRTTVTGNQEQPKVISIIPWQPPIGTEALQLDFSTSLIEANFQHIEPADLRRQLAYKDKLKAAAAETTATSEVVE